MALFKQQEPDEDNSLPEEVKEYYKAESREHIGVAWLLAFVTLVVTVAVIIGLFVAGRWAYRKYEHRHSTHTSSSQTTTAAKPQTTSSPSTSSSSPSTKSTSQPSRSASSSSATPSSAATGTTAPSQNLTNTGPGDTIAIFVGVTVLATFMHMEYSRRRPLKRQ